MTDKIIDNLRRDKICVVRNFADLEDEFDKMTKREPILKVNLEEIRKYPKTYSLFTSDFVKEISSGVWGKWEYDKVFIHHDKKIATTNNVFPHFDFDRKLKFYICVNDMNLENGCFKICPERSDLVEGLRKKDRSKNVFSPDHSNFCGIEIKREEMTPLIANAGDLIIFDTNLIHCGGDNFEDGKSRKVIRLHIK
jgi:hypothetical protein